MYVLHSIFESACMHATLLSACTAGFSPSVAVSEGSPVRVTVTPIGVVMGSKLLLMEDSSTHTFTVESSSDVGKVDCVNWITAIAGKRGRNNLVMCLHSTRRPKANTVGLGKFCQHNFEHNRT